MKIECLTTFLAGRDRFEKGDIRTVADDRAYWFIALGWAAKQGEAPAPASTAPAALDIHNSAIGLGDSNG